MAGIERVAVLGAGTMGARIAAHLANAGVSCFLLDIVAPGGGKDRNAVARAGLEGAKKAKPAAFFTADAARLITIGNFEDNLEWCAKADWIVEAVAEKLEIKRGLLERVEKFRRAGTIVSTNTSGLSIHLIAEGRSEDFKKHFAGTHFFNPPRYMKLVELIPGPQTRGEVLAALGEFCDRRLGKGVVRAKDTPNFIANRIGTFSLMNAMRLMTELDMSVEEVDACTGPIAGWPKSATFRTADIVGLDIIANVVRNIYERATEDESRGMYTLPEFAEEMIRRGWLGEKTRKGFYEQVRGAGGEKEIVTLDWKTMEYRPRTKSRFGSIEAAKGIEGTRERLLALTGPAMAGGEKADKASRFLWGSVSRTCWYAAMRVPEIADRVVDVDRAMRWGFAWELGPFEIWDAVGVEKMAARLEAEGLQRPALVEKLLSSGAKSFYEREKGETKYFDVAGVAGAVGKMAAEDRPAGILILKELKERRKVVQSNVGASLIDLGDGVVCCEFHSKMNSIGGDIVSMIHAGLKRLATDFEAMIIANQAVNFSVGANLMLLLVSAQEQEWDDLHAAVREFQRVNMAIKYAPKPVVVAPQGMALGGGCEISLHGAKIHAAAETYMGLVEAGVGLIPAGGGTKEMMIRANEHAAGGESLDLFHAYKPVFETIAMAKVSTSAAEAVELGYMRRSDAVAMNRDRLVADAKETALGLARSEYRAPTGGAATGAEVRVLGEELIAAAKLAIHMMLRGEFISEYDALVARKLAYVLAGGELSAPQMVSEQYVLDLEREAFVSLCGERKTQERIGHTLKTGKPLRN
jgi:3-hydroxyacyl-CoA dehydrogenase